MPCDECWIYCYDPETKRQSFQWKHAGPPRPKKATQRKSTHKLLMIPFFVSTGMISLHRVPTGQTNLKKYATETYGMLHIAFGPPCIKLASVFEWHKRFKESRESVRGDERCGGSKEVNTPELIGQRVRVRVTMLRFYASSGRDSVGRVQHCSNRHSGISTMTMHQSTTPSSSPTI